MKKTSLTLLLAICFVAGFSQLNNNGGIITVQTGATLVVEGNYTSTVSGQIEIDGTVQLRGNLINTSGSINSGSTGRLVLNGSGTAQEITGATSTTFHCAVEVNNTSGVALTATSTGNDQVLDSTLILTNGKVTLNGFDLTLADDGTSNADSTRYLITNGDGRVIAPVPTSGSILVPVGYSASNYAPVTLANANVAGNVAIQSRNDLLDGCSTGTALTNDIVTLGWDIDNSIGSVTEADITLQWQQIQEGTGFGRTDCAVIHCDAGEYSAVGAYGSATDLTGTFWSIAGTDITDFSWFGVGDGAFGNILVNAKVFLQGPYNVTNNDMDPGLTIPINQPYSGVAYTGTYLAYTGTESVTTVPTNAIDWVLVELRTGTGHATKVGTAAGFLLDNGSIVFYGDGTGYVPFKGLAPGNYYVAIHHRNHMSVMSSATLALTRTTASVYDFTSNLAAAYDNAGVGTNDAMQVLETGVYGMWAGDVNFNKTIVYNGGAADAAEILDKVGGVTNVNTPVVDGYTKEDVNMNGVVVYNGTASDMAVILDNIGGVTNVNATVSGHVPLP